MNHIERQLQICLNGLKFSKEKTKYVHFCNQYKPHLDPLLKIDHTEIPIVEEYKYLRVLFVRKLSFIPHIKYLRIKCATTMVLSNCTFYSQVCRDRPTNVNKSDYISPLRNNIRARPEMMKPFFDFNWPLQLRKG